MTEIKPGSYIHFEGNEYMVTGTALHSQTSEELVLYRAPNNDELWACPLSVWYEPIELDGRSLTRFTHVDDISLQKSDETPEGVHNKSKPEEKIKLFLSLFKGRTDVYAKRWDSNKTDRSGYSPDCYNFWKDICSKRQGKKVTSLVIACHDKRMKSQSV